MSTPAGDLPTRLAAIVFTDIAGYSRMMEEDEEQTIRVLKQHNDIVLPLVERSGGEVIDAIGDGLFILFPSVREAVACSIAVHEAVAAHNAEASEEERFRLRIGVHLGEIWREGDRAYGNGVNVAARVQPLARPGGICITEDVQRQIANKIGNEIRSIGHHELRNISRRMELFHVATGFESGAEPPVGAGDAPPHGELDEIKQRILGEREKIARRRKRSDETAGDEDRMERRIESKVYRLVEHVMDAAVSKWDQLPDEKKERAIARIQHEVEQKAETDITIGGDHGRRKGGDREESSEITSRLATGAVFGIGFGLGYFYFGLSWMVWPFAIIGVLPFLSGLVKAIKAIARRERDRKLRPRTLERTLLEIARRAGGRLTVVQAASAAELSLDEVQETLDRMTSRGYVVQNIRDTGVIEYEFPSLEAGPDRQARDAGTTG